MLIAYFLPHLASKYRIVLKKIKGRACLSHLISDVVKLRLSYLTSLAFHTFSLSHFLKYFIPHIASIFTAELHAFELALHFLRNHTREWLVIFSDSLSALATLRNKRTSHPFDESSSTNSIPCHAHA